MKKIRGVPRKLLIGAVAAIVLAQAVIWSLGQYESRDNKAAAHAKEWDGNDSSIAADISNMTGATTERILALKSSGRSWNEVLEQLKNGDAADNENSPEERNRQLLASGLGEEVIRNWVDEGYTEEDIWNAKLLTERTEMQMKQLAEPGDIRTLAPDSPPRLPDSVQAISPADTEQAFQSALLTVMNLFEADAAMEWMLTYNSEFGSNEEVLDEYLLTLQLELDLKDYAQDKDQYERDKAAKLAARADAAPLVSLAEMERRLLERIRQENASNMEQNAVEPIGPATSGAEVESEIPAPDVLMPKIEEVKPRNPAEEIREELERINPNRSNPR